MLIIVGGIVLFTIADIFLSADFDSGVQSFSVGFLAIFLQSKIQGIAIPVGKVIDISASHCLQLLISHHTGMI